MVLDVHYNKKSDGLRDKTKEGLTYGSHVPSIRLLDWNLCCHVLFGRYENDFIIILRTDWVFRALILFEIIRTDVYLHFRCIFDGILRWLYILDNIYDGAWTRRTLMKLKRGNLQIFLRITPFIFI